MSRPTFSPGMDATIRRFTGTILGPEVDLPGEVPNRRNKTAMRRLDAQRHKALMMMAKAGGIDPAKFKTDYDLWGAISERFRGGVMNPHDPVLGDPFCVFVTGVCEQGHPRYEQIAVKPTGVAVDQAKGEELADFLKAQDAVNTCEVCRLRCPACPIGTWTPEASEHGRGCPPEGMDCPCKISSWQVDMTRRQTFMARDHSASVQPRKETIL